MTKIPWTDESWNPLRYLDGWYCTKIAEGCRNCYSESFNLRFGNHIKYHKLLNFEGFRLDEKVLEKPFHWRKARKIFVCSMSDLFHEKVPFEFIDKVHAVAALCPQHCFQLLSKRPEIMEKYFENCLPRISALVYNAKYGQRKDIFGSGQNRNVRDRCTRPDMAAQEGSRTRSGGGRRILAGDKSQPVQAGSGGILDPTGLSANNDDGFEKKIRNGSAPSSVGISQRADTKEGQGPKKIDNKSRGRNQEQQSPQQFDVDDIQSTATSCVRSVESESLASSGQQAPKNKTIRSGCFEDTRDENGRNDDKRDSGAVPNEAKSNISNLHTSDLETHIAWPLSNLWLGTSISTQADADKNIPILLQIPAAVRFLSVEPMLERIDLWHGTPGWEQCSCGKIHKMPTVGHARCDCVFFQHERFNLSELFPLVRNLDWVIIGCESGPKRRPCKLEWVEDLIGQCDGSDGVPVFVKQLEIDGKLSRNPKEWPKWAQRDDYPKGV